MAAKKSSNSMLVAAGGTAIVLLAVTFVASQDWSHGRNRILDLAGASMGDAHARYDYAGRLEKDGKKQAALEWYEKSADGGYVPAMMAVADRYEAFDDEDSGDTAVKWYEKAAKAGNAEAMRKLAHAHETGRGSLQPSPILARGYFEQAAKAGDIESKARFGQMLMEEGKLKEAETWLTQAAAAGNGDAAASLGNLYYDFYSPLKDPVKAAQYYGQAAEAGKSAIMFNYAYIQFNGVAVKKDPAEALKWVLIASEVRPNDAAPAVYFLRTRLTPEQQKDGEERAAQWRKSHPKVLR